MCGKDFLTPMHIFLSFLIDTTGNHIPIIIDAIVKMVSSIFGA